MTMKWFTRPKTLRFMAVIGLLVGFVAFGAINAIGEARESARQAHRVSNLKQIGLGLHNYVTSWNSFPFAAYPNDRLPVEQRQSWQLEVLPFLFCSHCWGLDDVGKIDHEGPWNVGVQARFAVLPLDPLICPASPNQPPEGTYAGDHTIDRSGLSVPVATAYVGITGIGKDAASYPKSDPRAGIFGYARVTRLDDVTDGMSTTMMVAETSELQAPWTSGGAATVRGVEPARRPYLGKGRPFGGNHPGNAPILFADGSVRTIRDTIDPKVFEALATFAGHEPLPSGWEAQEVSKP